MSTAICKFNLSGFQLFLAVQNSSLCCLKRQLFFFLLYYFTLLSIILTDLPFLLFPYNESEVSHTHRKQLTSMLKNKVDKQDNQGWQGTGMGDY